MVENIFVEDIANRYVTAASDNAQITVIDNNEFVWSYVDTGTKYLLTGYILCFDNDTSVLFAQTTTKNVYIPIIDGKAEFTYSAKQSKASAGNIILPAILLILYLSNNDTVQ